MQNQISYTYSSKLAKQVSKQLWWKRNAPSYLYYGAVPLLTLLLCLASGEFDFKGDGEFIIGFLSGVVSIIAFVIAYSYFSIDKSAAHSEKKWRNAVLTYKLSETGLESDTGLSQAFYSWALFEKTQRLPSALILFVQESPRITIPTNAADEETIQFIERKIYEEIQNRAR